MPDQATSWDVIERRRRDLWIMPGNDPKALSAHDWFNGPFHNQKEIPWREWRDKNLVQFQEALFDRMAKDKLALISIMPHEKIAMYRDWPTAERRELSTLFRTGGNYAVKCGPKYNLLIVDLDPTDEVPAFWRQFKTLTTRTGEGFHLYFRHTRNLTDQQADWLYEQLCLSLEHRRHPPTCCGSVLRYGSGHGAYALVPLSIHPNGRLYEFLDWEAPIVPLTEVLEKMGQRKLG